MSRTLFPLFATATLMLGGCVLTRKNSGDEFLFGYSRDKEYETIVPLVLRWETDGTAGRRQALVVPPDVGIAMGGRLHSAPPASDPWGPCKSDSQCWVMGDIIAVVPAGSPLKVRRITASRGWGWWYGRIAELTPFASLRRTDGTTVEVDISDVSRFSAHNIRGKSFEIPYPDGEVLRSREGSDVAAP
jgi:hypothetical protein